MAIALKQSTASQEVPLGPFVDATDGVTAETGLTISNTDIKIWKTGATTLADKNSGGATHISNGIYYTVLDATDTDTLGPLVIFVQESGALPVRLECVVLNANNYDSAIAASDNLQVDVVQFGGTNLTASGGRPEVNTTHAAGTAWGSGAITAASIAADAITAAKIADGAIDAATFAASAITASSIAADAITAAKIATGAIDADALAADAVDEILDDTIGDGTITVRQALRVLVAACAGKLSGAATTTVTIRNVADSADVVVATVDANGNRTATTVTP